MPPCYFPISLVPAVSWIFLDSRNQKILWYIDYPCYININTFKFCSWTVLIGGGGGEGVNIEKLMFCPTDFVWNQP